MQERDVLGSYSASKLLRFVDHNETYGPHVIRDFVMSCPKIESAVDLGAGTGRDISTIKELHKTININAIECYPPYIKILEAAGCAVHSLDIESEKLPFANEGLDLVVANQFLEHTKELFWINHEVARVLKVGGYFLVGVPNVASLHNRIGLLFGKHPSQAKSFSAHVRCFSKNDFCLFFEQAFPGGYKLERFSGSQFYPFPRPLARYLAKIFPSMAFSIFFLFRKIIPYQGSFLEYPKLANLETNFKTE